MTPEKLAELAIQAMAGAYAPYSGYKVGAALLCADGTVYTFFKAITDGKREFTAIAVCGGKDGVIEGFFPPCGVCRQVMREFCKDDFQIHMVGKNELKTRTLSQLLPDSFSF